MPQRYLGEPETTAQLEDECVQFVKDATDSAPRLFQKHVFFGSKAYEF